MASDRETKEKLLESARKEFAKDGYMKASLRKICANAGVTTGALYFFFQDKADLFQSIVQEPYSQLLKWCRSILRRMFSFWQDPMPMRRRMEITRRWCTC